MLEHIPVTHLVPGLAMDYAVAKAIMPDAEITMCDAPCGFIIKEEPPGVSGPAVSFNPSTNSKDAEYALVEFIRIEMLKNDNPSITLICASQLRAWPNWSAKFDDTEIYRYMICATILMHTSQKDSIQNIKMLRIPKQLLTK